MIKSKKQIIKMEMILNEKDNDVDYTDNYSYE